MRAPGLPPYRDDHWLDIKGSVTFQPGDFNMANPKPIVAKGRDATRFAFKPGREIASAIVHATYRGAGLSPKTLDHEFRTRDDLANIEVDEFYVDDVALPKHPGQIPLSLAAFAADRLGGGVSWPVIYRSMGVQFLIRRGILDALARHRKLPPSYDEAPHTVGMDIALSVFGKALK